MSSSLIVKNPKIIADLISDAKKIKEIQALILEIPNYQNFKLNKNLVLYVIQLVEWMFKTKNRQKIVDIMTSIISHNQEEVLQLHSMIDQLYNSNRVQKVTLFRQVKYFILSNFFYRQNPLELFN